MKYLLATNIDPNPCDVEGNTPLHLCAKNESIDAYSELIAKGACVLAKNLKSQRPFDLASGKFKAEIEEYGKLFFF